MASEKQSVGRQIQSALLTGVSYMLPFVIGGGILIALGFLLGTYQVPSVEPYGSTFASTVFWLGKGAFSYMVPIVAAFIAYGIADKPAIAVGMLGGFLAGDPWGVGQASGFIGGIIAGILAGYIVLLLKKIKLPKGFESIVPTLIIPVVGMLIEGCLMFYVIGAPLSALTAALTAWLNGLAGGSAILLGIVQGCMLAFDMGGTVNKVAYAFALAAMDANNFAPMAANFIGSMTPPLGIALAVLISNKMGLHKWNAEEKSSGSIIGLFTGAIAMVTEYAIPYAVADPLRVIPALMAGSATGCALSYAFGLTMMAPHGGLFVLFALNNVPLFLLALVIGALVTTVLLLALKKKVDPEDEVEYLDDDDDEDDEE
jgi:PTS system fructose-specific IIC component